MTAALKRPSLLDEKQDWTVDDLASLPQDLRYELIDGRLILPSPSMLHQDIEPFSTWPGRQRLASVNGAGTSGPPPG